MSVGLEVVGAPFLVGYVPEWIVEAELLEHLLGPEQADGRDQEVDVDVAPLGLSRVEPIGDVRALEQQARHPGALQSRDDLGRHRIHPQLAGRVHDRPLAPPRRLHRDVSSFLRRRA